MTTNHTVRTRPVRTLSLAQALRVTIAAQGLDRPRPAAVTLRHITETIRRLGVIQIDSVNVLARAHLLPLFARLGPYDTSLVERAAGQPPRRMLETWAHEASYVPASTFPLLTWHRRNWNGMNFRRLEIDHPGLVDRVLAIVTTHGPMTSRQLEAHVDDEHLQRPKHRWGWAWTPAQTALEILFDAGEVTPAYRTAQFERVYDRTDRVVPPAVLAQPRVARDAAVTELIRIAARAHGIGTVRCFADYFRLRQDETKAAITLLESTGELVPVSVRGWNRDVWMDAAARVPRQVEARALVAPFDPLVFERRRLLELFGMHHRLEIYTPAAQRIHGYYVLPFLLDEYLVARVDLKHDRAAGVLVVAAAHAEPSSSTDVVRKAQPDRQTIVRELTAELQVMAQWLGADDVVISSEAHGDLIAALHHVV